MALNPARLRLAIRQGCGTESGNVKKDLPIIDNNKVDLIRTGQVYPLYKDNDTRVDKFYSVTFKSKDNYQGQAYIKFSQGNDYVIVSYDIKTGKYNVKGYSSELNNNMTGQAASSYYYDGAPGGGLGYTNDSGLTSTNQGKLNIFTDKNSIEIFFPNGQSYTIARFATSDLQTVEFYTDDKNSTLDLTEGIISDTTDLNLNHEKNQSIQNEANSFDSKQRELVNSTIKPLIYNGNQSSYLSPNNIHSISEPQVEKKYSSLPKTGEKNNVLLQIGLLIMSLLSLGQLKKIKTK